jgi:hypothetical protein
MKELKATLNNNRAFTTNEEKIEIRKSHEEEYQKYNHQYYEKNKEKIKDRQALIITCDCGCKMNTSSKIKHEKTKKHFNLIQNKTN